MEDDIVVQQSLLGNFFSSCAPQRRASGARSSGDLTHVVTGHVKRADDAEGARLSRLEVETHVLKQFFEPVNEGFTPSELASLVPGPPFLLNNLRANACEKGLFEVAEKDEQLLRSDEVQEEVSLDKDEVEEVLVCVQFVVHLSKNCHSCSTSDSAHHPPTIFALSFFFQIIVSRVDVVFVDAVVHI